jgi:long-chain-alcohol oxidase
VTQPAEWSERQLRALSALFETIAGSSYVGESERHAQLATAALAEVAEPSDLTQVKLALSLFETRLGALTLGLGTAAYSKLSRGRREQILHSWSTSHIAGRRRFYQLIKRLGAFFAYADPGMDGRNPRWGPMGYEVPDHPIPDAGAVAAAIIRPPDWPLDLELKAEIVVVGSGAGGGVVAARLAEAGHDVLVIEAGPYVPEADLPRDEMDAFTRIYLDHGLTATRDLGVSILAGAALGGGTLVNWATCFAPPDRVRMEWARRHGIEGFDSEATDKDIERLHLELGFAPPPSIGPKDRAILDGAAALGWEAAPTERNADGCTDCGACGFGCRRGSKRSGQRLHLALAVRHGTRLLTDAPVDRIEIAGGRASGVSGVVGGGRPFSVRARKVVVAAGALRTPLLLLRSGLDHAEIGRNLHLHPTAAIGARFEGDVEMWRGPMQAARSLELVDAGVLIESAPAHPGLIALAFPWRGADALNELMRDIRHYAPFIGIVRDSGSGRVRVTRSGRARIDYRMSERDAATARLGLVAMARIGRAAGATRLVALGTPAAWHDVEPGHEAGFDRYLDRLAKFDYSPNRGSLFSAHQMGTARAGADPRTSVCDPFGRVRAAGRSDSANTVDGLYVADSSLFPTALGLNPMVTIMALASRVARAVHEDSSN